MSYTRNITVRDTDGTAWLTVQAGPEYTSHAIATETARRYKMTDQATITVDGCTFHAADLLGYGFEIVATAEAKVA